MCIRDRAEAAGVSLDEKADLTLLDGEELALVKLAAQFPRTVEGAAMAHEPHRIAFYLYDLAAAFHALWNRGNDDPGRRLLLARQPRRRGRRRARADPRPLYAVQGEARRSGRAGHCR